MIQYRVTNSAGGTELSTDSRDSAIAEINKLQFPGKVLAIEKDGSETEVDLELDQDGQWAEAQSTEVQP